ncbi:hypothetical protein Pla110_13540 [Polystyrenella longa]|uniref:Uncharacterized protein n=1 Tax=Polystyrenella longa TaxID=2528007 RepID=A0A518CK88_9PLAN|nr:hypothetical protein [Polystyrenella longa]QDU79643.1 hypothetical protein Pla110_13540 [Polystyrenella longa]
MGKAYNMWGEEIEIHLKCRCLVGQKRYDAPPRDGSMFLGEWETKEGYPNVTDFYFWNDELELFQVYHRNGIAFERNPLWWAPWNGKDGGK